MVGLDGSLMLRHADWHPQLDPWLLMAINAAAMAWLVVLSECFAPPQVGANHSFSGVQGMM